MMKVDSDIVTEFRGIDSITFVVLGNRGLSETQDETGCEVLKDIETLRSHLQNTEFPQRKEISREARVDIITNKSYVKARIYYKAFFRKYDASDDQGKFRSMQYWKFPIQYVFEYNDVPDAIRLYEDIELRFFNDVTISMDNKDQEWIQDSNDKWKKHSNASSLEIKHLPKDKFRHLRLFTIIIDPLQKEKFVLPLCANTNQFTFC